MSLPFSFKDGYYGPNCQYAAATPRPPAQCEADQFLASEAAVSQCVDCFCSAIPDPRGGPSACAASELYRDQVRAALDEEEMEFMLVDSSLETVISGQQLTLNTTHREVSYDGFQQLGDHIFYWKLPSEFLGNKARTKTSFFYI